jgi:cation:H+ antiporter
MADNLLLAIIFTVGLLVLWFGAEWLVRGSADLALKLGIRPMVVGLTVVAFGTSAPELVVSVIAALSNSPEIAIGNVVGSNIANICLIVGFTALLLPIPSDRSFLKMDMPMLFGAMALLYLVSFDGKIAWYDGLALLGGLLVFNIFTYKTAGRRGEGSDMVDDEHPLTVWKAVLYFIAGMAALMVGARMMVYSAVEIAGNFGISEVVIGATIVAIGTSLPELATSLVAVLKKQPDLGLGNVIGSNVFNICSILGFAPLITTLPIARHLLVYEYPLMVGSAIILLLMLAKRSNRITRPEGLILLIGYIAFLIWAFYTGTQ